MCVVFVTDQDVEKAVPQEAGDGQRAHPPPYPPIHGTDGAGLPSYEEHQASAPVIDRYGIYGFIFC